jgi:hypothetical protein
VLRADSRRFGGSKCAGGGASAEFADVGDLGNGGESECEGRTVPLGVGNWEVDFRIWQLLSVVDE